MSDQRPGDELTKKEALLEALRLLLDHELVEVRGITVYLRAKPDSKKVSEQNPVDPDQS